MITFMPTASKLVAALLMAVLGWIVSDMIRPLMQEGTDFGIFNQLNAFLGFLAGWITVGRRTGNGWMAGMGAGITGMMVMVFWGLFLQASYEMYQESLLRRYSDPMEALNGLFKLFWEFLQIMATQDIITVLLASAVVIGLLAEWAARSWK